MRELHYSPADVSATDPQCPFPMEGGVSAATPPTPAADEQQSYGGSR
jgi:hypothetical protein